MTNILVVAADAPFVDRVTAIPGHRVVSISRENVATVAHDTSFHPGLILVGSGLSRQQTLQYASGVLEAYPAMPVVLVADADPDLMREARRVGVRGVVPRTISDKDLAGLVGHLGAATRVDTPSAGPHQVIVVASPKGGVGKTTVAVNLAALLAEQAPGEVVLLDMDLQFGDVSTVLDLQPQYTVADALDSGAGDSMLLRTLLVSHPSNFYVLCGADHPAATGPVTGDEVRKLVHQFASTFRHVVIDTSAGLQEETLASLEEASDVVFVATLDVATLRNVRKEVDVLAELGLLPEHRHVILNRTDGMSGLTERDAESTMGLPVEAMLPASSTVSLAANHGRLAVEVKKSNSVRRPLRHFARTISAECAVPESPRVAPPRQRQRPGRHR
ncbi:MAG TPA: P-loop NTPase [Aeromicrobium sp.]|nr:P-loop NTPase [Aeromicrobium sp.]